MGTNNGREKRTDRTRTSIVEAWLLLVEDGVVEPTAQAVADRAHVGRRTVFTHFQDLESLHHEAAELHLKRIADLLVLPSVASSFDVRLAEFVKGRVALLERATPLRRANAAAQTKSVSANTLMAAADQMLGHDVSRLFEEELSRFSEDLLLTIEPALHVATSWAAWNQLRSRQLLSVASAQRVMSLQIESILRPVSDL
jgi:TetR/AcrR family transcriptional regulator, regulator of autoinduction and epiphytic fitness